MNAMLTCPQVARRYGVSPDKVLSWIRTGQLHAVNVAQRPTGRPRWRISHADLAAFEAARSARPAPIIQRCRRKALGVREYF